MALRQINPLKNSREIEAALADFSYRKKEIAALVKRNEQLKKRLVISYFADCEEYLDCNGVVLATYKEYKREGLDCDKLKTNMPEIWEEYKKITMYMQFSVK